jgi:hypothetical protein
MNPRFVIRRLRGANRRTPWILKDRDHPSYLGASSTFERALRKAENRVRAEAGLPPLLAITSAEILAEMEKKS